MDNQKQETNMPEPEQITIKEIQKIYGFSAGEVNSFICRQDAPKSVIIKKGDHSIRYWPRAELLDYINNNRPFDMINARFLLKCLAALGLARRCYG